MANLSAIEMTGVGRQFADDVGLNQFQIAYFRQDVLGGDLYLNFFTNINDQKTTYSLVNGNVVYDESSNRAFQLQHTVPMKNGQTVIWGLDYLDRTPETKVLLTVKTKMMIILIILVFTILMKRNLVTNLNLLEQVDMIPITT